MLAQSLVLIHNKPIFFRQPKTSQFFVDKSLQHKKSFQQWIWLYIRYIRKYYSDRRALNWTSFYIKVMQFHRSNFKHNIYEMEENHPKKCTKRIRSVRMKLYNTIIQLHARRRHLKYWYYQYNNIISYNLISHHSILFFFIIIIFIFLTAIVMHQYQLHSACTGCTKITANL